MPPWVRVRRAGSDQPKSFGLTEADWPFAMTVQCFSGGISPASKRCGVDRVGMHQHFGLGEFAADGIFHLLAQGMGFGEAEAAG